MALDTQTPILPMVVIGAGRLMPPGTLRLLPGRIKIVVGKEIPVTRFSSNDVSALRQETFQAMEKLILENRPSNKLDSGVLK
jgi:1-acyl-sn-glycerol-3-phosphate acyltransferase